MPELQLFMTGRDEVELVKFVLSEGAGLIPDLDYPRPKLELVSNGSEFVSARALTRHFFIVRDDYFKMPLQLRKIEKQGKLAYYITQRKGGPTVDFLASGIFTRDGGTFIRPGMVSHYPTFFDDQKGCFQKTPKELIGFYRDITHFLKESYVRVKPKKVAFWLSPDAQSELRQGAKLIGLEDLSAEEILKAK